LDNFSANVVVDDQQINLQLWHTAGQEDYKQARMLSYPQTDVFIICFSLVSPYSLEKVQSMWAPEIKKHCPRTPYILVGMKSDLRDIVAANPDEWKAKGMEPVPQSKGEDMKKAIGARAYIECSAKMQINVKEVFEQAIRVALSSPRVESTPRVESKGDAGGGRCEVY
jgi:Ras-related C3 botulinum toxin substrate 1